MPQGITATTQGLNDFMACRKFNGATIQVDVLDMIQKSWHWGPDNIMNKYYNDKISEKAIMQIER